MTAEEGRQSCESSSAGATGAIGQYLVPSLIAAGYEVTGSTRSPARADGSRAGTAGHDQAA
jgi:uncharacterized protein YbjT (DUF2867 family)